MKTYDMQHTCSVLPVFTDTEISVKLTGNYVCIKVMFCLLDEFYNLRVAFLFHSSIVTSYASFCYQAHVNQRFHWKKVDKNILIYSWSGLRLVKQFPAEEVTIIVYLPHNVGFPFLSETKRLRQYGMSRSNSR